jgi:thymidylate synthase
MRTGYLELVDWVLSAGKPVSPRGYKTYEIQDATFTLQNPLDTLPVGIGRKPKLAIGAAEALLLCGGIASPGLLTSVSNSFRRFMEGGDLHGGYGRRIGPQFARAADRLLKDPDTRQAVMTVWDPFYDQLDTRDLPCTIAMNFRIRDDKLNMGVVMRSNDIWLGTPYDVFMFTQLQATMANVIGREVGTYTHHAWSLHAYERNLEAIRDLHDFNRATMLADLAVAGLATIEHPSGFGLTGQSAETVMQRARDVHDDMPLPSPTASEAWYTTVLQPFERLRHIENFAA